MQRPVVEANATLRRNLEALAPAVRPALDPAAAGGARVDLSAGFDQASVLTPAGVWVPMHTADPRVEAEAWLDGVGEVPTLVLVGLGLGYALDVLERRPGLTRVLAIEPVPAMARAMLARRDWRGWLTSRRLTVLVGPQYAGAVDARRLFMSGGTPPPIRTAPLLAREFPDVTARARDVAEQIISGADAVDAPGRQYAGRYLLNVLNNLTVLVSEGDAASLAGAFTGVPTLVIGAGPSLDRDLDELRRRQDRALLVAVDMAVPPLLAAGIRPHLVVSVNPAHSAAQQLAALHDTRGMWLAAEASSDPALFAQFAGRSFVFRRDRHEPWPWLASQYLDRGRIDTPDAALAAAFDLALDAGGTPVTFVGCDLAFTGGRRFCRNTVHGAHGPELDDLDEPVPIIEEPGVRGGATATAPDFARLRDWLAARSNDAGCDVVNATGAGILRGGGIRHAALSTLLPGNPGDVRDRLAACWSEGLECRLYAHEVLRHVLARGPAAIPIDTWLVSSGDSVTRAQVVDHLDAARRALALLVPARSSAKYVL